MISPVEDSFASVSNIARDRNRALLLRDGTIFATQYSIIKLFDSNGECLRVYALKPDIYAETMVELKGGDIVIGLSDNRIVKLKRPPKRLL